MIRTSRWLAQRIRFRTYSTPQAMQPWRGHPPAAAPFFAYTRNLNRSFDGSAFLENTPAKYEMLARTLVSLTSMAASQKITVDVPTGLLQRAQAATGEGVTATVREGLRLLAARRAQRELTRLRGKVKFTLDIEDLRED